jgi:hypothetical protein
MLTILIIQVVPLSQELPTYQPGADPEVDQLMKKAEQIARRRRTNSATEVRYVRTLGPAVVSEVRLHDADLVAVSVPDMERLPSDEASHTDLRVVLRQVSCAVMLFRPSR